MLSLPTRVAAALLLTVGAVAVPQAAQAAAADDFKLTYSSTATAAGAIPMVKATMTDILNDSNYFLQPGSTACDARGTAAVLQYWCFDPGDKSDPAWTPQAVSTSSDEGADERWNSIRSMLVGWYDDGDAGKGNRVSAINLDTGGYRNILLAETDGSADFAPLGHATGSQVHIGGMVWYGRNLYVADTNYGIRVFSLSDIYDLGASTNGTTSCSGTGLSGSTYCAGGYKYVMLQVAFWKRPAGSTKTHYCDGTAGNPRFSWLTLDRATTPDRLVTGEFCSSAESGGQNETKNGRLAAYPMADAVPGSGVTTLSPSSAPSTLPAQKIQGAAFDGTHWYFNASYGSSQGVTYETTPAMAVVGTKPAPVRAEDLSLWRADHQLYSVTDGSVPSQRMVYRATAF